MSAHVALGQGVAMAPALINERFKAGQPLAFDIAVANETDKPIVMQGTVMDWWYNDKNEKVFNAPGTFPRSAANWVEFVPRQFEIPAASTKKVHVVVTPPASGETTGGHYAVLFLESKPVLVQAGTAESKALYTNIRLGALLLLAQENTEVFHVEVNDAKLSQPDKSRNLRVDFEVHNRSNSHIYPVPRLAILDAQKQLVGKAEGKTQRFLPEQRDRMSITWPSALKPGTYTAILTLVYGDNQAYTQEFPFTVSE
ncbi:MAG: hypothetical protein HYX28_02745 [Candidatus Koribacter versatilis]|uniref:Uncharacterized protein n=1 Tax=Candidatus Korobacter versatilis TaxID=658062 RepID=A0A932A8T0_9BACT|nr:hypothetical protein [Candidatus Koribacter versatilis]